MSGIVHPLYKQTGTILLGCRRLDYARSGDSSSSMSNESWFIKLFPIGTELKCFCLRVIGSQGKQRLCGDLLVGVNGFGGSITQKGNTLKNFYNHRGLYYLLGVYWAQFYLDLKKIYVFFFFLFCCFFFLEVFCHLKCHLCTVLAHCCLRIRAHTLLEEVVFVFQ